MRGIYNNDAWPVLGAKPLGGHSTCKYLANITVGRLLIYLNRGSDIHVGTDGNLHHRHCTASGDSPAFYEPTYFLPKEQVDLVGDRLEQARNNPVKLYKPKVPDEAVDDCENAHTATNGSQNKTSAQFDDNGLMALVCHHDIPLFFANIDTPGEQQKYAVALFEHLFTLLPTQATVTGLYDVGCVLDRSAHLVSHMNSRLSLFLKHLCSTTSFWTML